MSNTSTQKIEAFADNLVITIDTRGTGRPVLILHGGGGPFSVAGFAEALGQHAHAITPIHPGFGGTARPDWLDSVEKLAAAYLALLDRLALREVLVIGFSMGGWIASALAAQDSSRLRGLVLVNPVGIAVEGESVADVFAMNPAQLAAHSYHDPDKFRIDPARMSPEQLAGMAANFKALAVYGGKQMLDPHLRARLTAVETPALVAWGESDRIVTPAYGRAFAASFANGRFAAIAECGHMPQIEQPARLMALMREFDANLIENTNLDTCPN